MESIWKFFIYLKLKKTNQPAVRLQSTVFWPKWGFGLSPCVQVFNCLSTLRSAFEQNDSVYSVQMVSVRFTTSQTQSVPTESNLRLTSMKSQDSFILGKKRIIGKGLCQ